MSAAPRHRVALLYGLLLLFFCGGADGSEVPPPQNVTTKTLNTNYTLSWDWAPGAAGTHAVTFTTQYMLNHQLNREPPNWITACNQTSHRSCDLTRFKLLFLGDFMLRVRATVDGRHSEWAQKEFCPYEEAFIGPPDVTLHVTGTSLEVSIKDPVFKYSELREVYTVATYNITYWKSSPKEEVKKILETRQDRVVLSNLDPMSEYCVQVQIIYDMNPRPGDYSDVVCEHTGDVDAAPWVAAVVAFVVMAAVVALVVTLVVYWTRISKFLCPEVVLPPHFKESLLPANPSIYPVSLPSEHCDQVSIIADHRTEEKEEEEEGGCSTQPDTSQDGG